MLNWDEYNKEESQVAPVIKNTTQEAPKSIEPVAQPESIAAETSPLAIEAGSRAAAARNAQRQGSSG